MSESKTPKSRSGGGPNRKPYRSKNQGGSGRPGYGGGKRGSSRSQKPDKARSSQNVTDNPEPPADFDQTTLPRGVKAELRGLPKDLADKVGAHLGAVGQYLDEDPELASKHGQAAKRLAARLPVVRQVAADAAYNAGDFATALTDYRAVYRMTGNPDFMPVIADCERGIGKVDMALRTIREAANLRLSDEQQIELAIVEAGIRRDQGKIGEGLRILKRQLTKPQASDLGKARLRYAYADFLEAAGHPSQAKKWFSQAARFDHEWTLDSAARISAIDGFPYEEDADDVVYQGFEDDESLDSDQLDSERAKEFREEPESLKAEEEKE